MQPEADPKQEQAVEVERLLRFEPDAVRTASQGEYETRLQVEVRDLNAATAVTTNAPKFTALQLAALPAFEPAPADLELQAAQIVAEVADLERLANEFVDDATGSKADESTESRAVAEVFAEFFEQQVREVEKEFALLFAGQPVEAPPRASEDAAVAAPEPPGLPTGDDLERQAREILAEVIALQPLAQQEAGIGSAGEDAAVASPGPLGLPSGDDLERQAREILAEVMALQPPAQREAGFASWPFRSRSER
jgi:hypothetical protein